MLKKIALMLEMIKFKHTVFALPFAFMGAFLGAGGVPGFSVFLWVVLAMVGARTCAMGFNRIVDRKFDAANPRTVGRALPAGEVKLWEAWAMVIASGGLFFFSSYQLNDLTLAISPLALFLTLLYSLTKRFTWFCHVVLGVALAFSPLGGFVAVTGSLQGFPWILSLGVLFWVSGFDMVYACLDANFDRDAGLYSIPARFGKKGAFRLAGCCHALAFSLFTGTGMLMGLNWFYFAGIIIAGCAMLYQHWLVDPDDLARINISFFTMNGLISVTLFCATWLALAT